MLSVKKRVLATHCLLQWSCIHDSRTSARLLLCRSNYLVTDCILVLLYFLFQVKDADVGEAVVMPFLIYMIISNIY